jgi:hypothetical protein
MDEDKYSEYIKKVTRLSIYDYNVVYDKLYGLPIKDEMVLLDLTIKSMLHDSDIADLILFKHFLKKRKNKKMFKL